MLEEVRPRQCSRKLFLFVDLFLIFKLSTANANVAITQLQQEEIPASIRGVVVCVQQALNALFTLLSFALGILFPDPKKDFLLYVLAGVFSIGAATILFALGVYYPRSQHTR